MILTDISILDTLTPNPDEVDRIFTHPLDAIIDPPLASGEPLSGIGSEDWPYEAEYYVRSNYLMQLTTKQSGSTLPIPVGAVSVFNT